MAVIRVEKRSERLRRRLIVLLVILAILGIALWLFDKRFRVDPKNDVKVSIPNSTGIYTEEEIREYAYGKRWLDRYSIFVRYYYKYHKIEPLPFLERIDITVSDQDEVIITAYEKPAVACIYDMGFYLYFNRDGEIVTTKRENEDDLPVVKGLVYTNLTLFEKFKTQDEKLFDVILNLVSQAVEKHQIDVDEIIFNGDLSVVLTVGANTYRLGYRNAYDVQIAMIPEVEKRLAQRNADNGRTGGYEINMEGVFKSDDEFYAREITETDGSGGDEKTKNDASGDKTGDSESKPGA